MSTRQVNEHVYELYRPERGTIDVEIVFFHGLDVHVDTARNAYFSTWRSSSKINSVDSEILWPKMWLADAFPKAHIYAVGYDPGVFLDPGNNSWHTLGENLVESLTKASVGQRCPVILVGHCVGCLVMKQIVLGIAESERRSRSEFAAGGGKGPPGRGVYTYLYANFLDNLRAVFYYSSPRPGDLNREATDLVNEEFARLRRQHRWKAYGVKAGMESLLMREPNIDYVTRSQLEIESAANLYDRFDGVEIRKFGCDARPIGDSETFDVWDVNDFCTIPGADHFTVCRPCHRRCKRFELLVHFIEVALGEEEQQTRLQRSLRLPLKVIQMDERINSVIEKLQLHNPAGPPLLALVGTHGIGKSTLAKQVLIAVTNQFDFTCFVEVEDFPRNLIMKSQELWRLVAENLKLFRRSGQQVLLEELHQHVPSAELEQDLVLTGATSNLGEILTRVLYLFKELKLNKVINILMIVDGVDSEEEISCLVQEFKMLRGDAELDTRCSRLLITSSNVKVTDPGKVHEVCLFTPVESLRLFEAHVESFALRAIPRKLIADIVGRCDGLPLTLEVIGSYLRGKADVTVWHDVLKRLQEAEAKAKAAADIVEILLYKLKVSYDLLAETEKKLFLDAAMFDLSGSDGKRYDLYFLKTACNWSIGSDGMFIYIAMRNLVSRSLLHIVQDDKENKHVDVPTIQGVYIHKQLRKMGRWISGSKYRSFTRLEDEPWPIYIMETKDLVDKENMHVDVSERIRRAQIFSKLRVIMSGWFSGSKYKRVSGLEDVPNCLSERKGETTRTEVFTLTLTCSRQDSLVTFPILPYFGAFTALRFLKLSGRIELSHPFEFPPNLTMLHLENCFKGSKTSILQSRRSTSADYWPIRGEDIETLLQLSVLILKNCSPIHLPHNFQRLRNLKILHISSPKSQNLPDHDKSNFHDVVNPKNGQKILKTMTLTKHIPHLYLPKLLPKRLTDLSITAPFKKLPDSILQLSSLQRLTLSACSSLVEWPVQTASDSSYLTSLSSLVLTNLTLTELPDSFGKMESLIDLQLQGCEMLRELPEGFGDLTRLKTLKIECCGGLKSLCKSFDRLSSLQSLVLRSLSVLRFLPERFGHLSSLRYLTLDDCGTMRTLPRSFVELESLRELHVVSCCSLEYLWHDQNCHLKHLVYLRVSKCKNLRGLDQSLRKLSALKRLTVDCYEDGLQDSRERLFKSAKQLTALQVVELSRLRDDRRVDVSRTVYIPRIPVQETSQEIEVLT